MEPISHARWAEGSLSVYDTQLCDVFETALTTGKPCSNMGEDHDRHVFSPLTLLKHLLQASGFTIHHLRGETLYSHPIS